MVAVVEVEGPAELDGLGLVGVAMEDYEGVVESGKMLLADFHLVADAGW